MIEVLAGLVDRVTFHNSDNGSCVLRSKPAVGGLWGGKLQRLALAASR